MRHLLLLPALLVALPARASVYARNDDSDINNNVDMVVTNEWAGGLLVPNLSAVLTIPPRVAQQYHVIRLCHDGTASAWCTLLIATAPHSTELFRAIQTNHDFQFHSDYEFDDCSIPPGCCTGGVWVYSLAKGCWPAGLASAMHFCPEARHILESDSANLGFHTQVNAPARFDQRKRQWTAYACSFRRDQGSICLRSTPTPTASAYIPVRLRKSKLLGGRPELHC